MFVNELIERKNEKTKLLPTIFHTCFHLSQQTNKQINKQKQENRVYFLDPFFEQQQQKQWQKDTENKR